MNACFIYDAVRTPRGRGKVNGSLHSSTSLHLTTTCLNALATRNPLDSKYIEEIIMGCVMPVGEQGGNIARSSALAAGFPHTTPALQINRFCSSSLDAINLAAAKILAGHASYVIAGGVESMSRIPMNADGGALIADPKVAFEHGIIPQGISADLIATREKMNREKLDTFAVQSHQKAHFAQTSGYLDNGIVPVLSPIGTPVLKQDELIRPETSVEALSQLKPSFAVMAQMAGFDEVAIGKYPNIERINYVHHAGNSSGIANGASAVLLGTESSTLEPLARFVTCHTVGSEPTIMLTGPIEAAKGALLKAGLTAEDIDLWEINEAFASVALHVISELGVSPDKVNVNGGAIALGHPLGATGAMLVGTAAHELKRTKKKRALITLCTAMGMGVATIIERI